MDIDLGRQMVRAAFKASGELEAMLPILREGCSEDEYRDLARGIAAAIDGVNRGLLGKAIASHPELEAEIDADIQKHGVFLG